MEHLRKVDPCGRVDGLESFSSRADALATMKVVGDVGGSRPARYFYWFHATQVSAAPRVWKGKIHIDAFMQ